jgi:ribonuclease-3
VKIDETRKQERLMRLIGYTFKQPKLLKQALTHRSAHAEHNERLEFLGDSILGFVIAEALYSQFEQATEGNLSRMRSTLVKEHALMLIAKQFQIGEQLYLGSGELKSGGFRKDSILADSIESVIGAIYLDSDFGTVKKCILSWYDSQLSAIDPQMSQKDPKTLLQEHLQRFSYDLPHYEVTKIEGPQHNQHFTVCCTMVVDGETYLVEARGNSRRKAEQSAASKALEKIETL